MPRTKKGGKFFLYAKAKSGHRKGKYLIGLRGKDATLQEMIDFLKEQNIDPSAVEIPGNFSFLAT